MAWDLARQRLTQGRAGQSAVHMPTNGISRFKGQVWVQAGLQAALSAQAVGFIRQQAAFGFQPYQIAQAFGNDGPSCLKVAQAIQQAPNQPPTHGPRRITASATPAAGHLPQPVRQLSDGLDQSQLQYAVAKPATAPPPPDIGPFQGQIWEQVGSQKVMSAEAVRFIVGHHASGVDAKDIAGAFPAGGPTALQVQAKLELIPPQPRQPLHSTPVPAVAYPPQPVGMSDSFDPRQLSAPDWKEAETIYTALQANRRLPHASQSLGTRPDGHELTSIKVWTPDDPRPLKDRVREPLYAGLVESLDPGTHDAAGRKVLQGQSLLLRAAESGRVFLLISKKAEEGLDGDTVLKLRAFAGMFCREGSPIELRLVQKHLAQLGALGKHLNSERNSGPWKLGALLDHCIKGTTADPDWDAVDYLMQHPIVSGYLSGCNAAGRANVEQGLTHALKAFITGGHPHGLRHCTPADRQLLGQFARTWPTSTPALAEGSTTECLYRFADWLAEQGLDTLETRTQPPAAAEPMATSLARYQETASEVDRYAQDRKLSPQEKHLLTVTLANLRHFRETAADSAGA